MTEDTDLSFHDPSQRFELEYWGDCTNTLREELKQFVYANRMKIPIIEFRGQTCFDAGHKKVCDVGGGPVSMLLKTTNLQRGLIVDPGRYPAWIYDRYHARGLRVLKVSGEHLSRWNYDEVWIYNTLQHVLDPAAIIANAFRAAPVIRLFEWIDFPPHPGHPHMLTAKSLSSWLGAGGAVERLSESECFGNSFSGVFSRP